MNIVVMVIAGAVVVLAVVVIVGIVAFAHTANKVVDRSRTEDLPKVLETIGRTQSGLVGVMGRGIRQMRFPSGLPSPASTTPSAAARLIRVQWALWMVHPSARRLRKAAPVRRG